MSPHLLLHSSTRERRVTRCRVGLRESPRLASACEWHFAQGRGWYRAFGASICLQGVAARISDACHALPCDEVMLHPCGSRSYAVHVGASYSEIDLARILQAERFFVQKFALAES